MSPKTSFKTDAKIRPDEPGECVKASERRSRAFYAGAVAGDAVGLAGGFRATWETLCCCGGVFWRRS